MALNDEVNGPSESSEPTEQRSAQASTTKAAESAAPEQSATVAEAAGSSRIDDTSMNRGSDPGQRSTTATGSPLWISVAFLAGLVLLYLGQRVILKWEGAAEAATWLGVVAMLGSTAARFAPALRGRGEQAEVARVLDGLQLLGLAGVAIYGATTNLGSELLGLTGPALEKGRAVLTIAWVVCALVSVTGLLFAELSLHPMRHAARVEGRRVLAAAVSGTVLALAASYCALFVYAAAQQEAQADFSYFKTSEPGEATVKLVQRSARPVQVTAFFPAVNQVRKEVEGYLKQLQTRSGNLEYRIVDRYLEPTLAKELKVISDGAIVLALDDATQSLTLGTVMDKARTKLIKLDGEFHEKLLKLATPRRTVYLTTGHGELNDSDRGAEQPEGRSARIVKELLQHQNFRVSELGLSQGLGKEVPDDAGAVLVLGPTRPFAPEETAALARYAKRGGKLLLALDADGVSTGDVVGMGTRDEASPEGSSDADQAPAPSVAADKQWLTELAATVGARFIPSRLADPVAHVVRRNDPSDRVIMPSNRFSSHASVSTLSRNSARAAVVVMGASYLEDEDAGMGKPVVTLRSLPSAFADENGDYQMNDGESKRAFNLAVALSREVDGAVDEQGAAAEGADAPSSASDDAAPAPAPDADAPDDAATPPTPSEMRAFVLADADALSDLLMERVAGNQMLLIDAMRWLVGEESLAGEISSEQDVRIEHTKQEDVAWFYSTIFGVPSLVLGLGIWTSRRTRRKPSKTEQPNLGAAS